MFWIVNSVLPDLICRVFTGVSWAPLANCLLSCCLLRGLRFAAVCLGLNLGAPVCWLLRLILLCLDLFGV